jgi:PAS domain S-box-containing protein
MKHLYKTGAARKKSLSQRFHFYRKFVDHLPVGMAVLHVPDLFDTHAWKLVAVNWLAAHLVGSSAEAFLNGPIAANLPPSKIMPDLVRDTLRLGKTKSLGHVKERGPSSTSSYWARLFPIDDTCVGFAIEDHSLLRQARQARADSEQRCRLMAEFARAILWRADPVTLEFTYVSPEGQQILGFWPERWLTETNFWKNHLHHEDRERVINLCYAATSPGSRSQDCECRMISASGNVIWFRLLIRPVFGQHGVSELSGIMTEISKLKEAERSTQDLSRRLLHVQDREHRRLSRELHETVGQNLAALRTSLAVLEFKDPLLDDQAKQAVAQAAHLVDLSLKEIRTVSSLLHPPALEEAGLSPALELFVEGFAKRCGIQVRMELPPDPFRMPSEMELALFRVVQECLANIHRHARSESADIRIQSLHNAVLLEVADYGRGMPPQLQAELQQGPGAGGTGISGMRERVAEMDGRLEIDSNGNGTTIRVLVPLQAQIAANLLRRAAAEPKGVIPFARIASPGKT